MTERGGVVSVDVEPNLSTVGSTVERFFRGLRPFGLKAELQSTVGRDLDRESRAGQRSLDSINTRRAQGELTQLGSVGQRELGRLGSSINLSGGQMVALGGGAITVGSQILRGLTPAVRKASELNETIGSTEVTFGDAFASAMRFAEGSAQAIGLSQQASLRALGTFGTYAKLANQEGEKAVEFAENLTSRAADVGALKGFDTGEVVDMFSSALRGEFDPIERVQVILNETIVKEEALRRNLIKTKSEALDPSTRAWLVYQLILEQTAEATGQFDRERDGFAGREKVRNAEMEDAQTKLGASVEKVWAGASSAATKFLGVVEKVPGGLEAVGVAAAGIGVTSILGGSVSSILGARKMIKEYLEERRSLSGVGDLGDSTAAVGTDGVAAAMDRVTTSSTAAGAAGTRAMSGIATSATTATSAVTATGAALSVLGAQSVAPVADDLARLNAEVRGLPSGRDFIDVEVISDSFDDVRAVGPGVASTVGDIGAASAAATPRVSRFGGAVRQIGSIGQAAFSQLTSAATIAGGVLVGLPIVEAISAIANELRGLDAASKESMDNFVANIDGGRVDILGAFNNLSQIEDSSASLADGFKSFGAEFSFAGVTDVRDIEYFQQAFDKISMSRPTAEVQTFIDAAREQNSQLDHNSTAYIETEKLLDKWQETVNTATKAQKVNNDTTKVGAEQFDQFGFAIDQAKGKYGQYIDSITNVTATPFAAVDALQARIDANEEVAEAEAEVARIRAGGTRTAEEAAEAERDLADAVRSVASAKRDQLGADRDLADANRDLADLQAELAHVDPVRDPNRYRDLSEKVRDAQDAQLDAQDRVADAADSVYDAEQRVADARSNNADQADDLAAAEERLEEARRRQRDADLDAEAALGDLNDTLAQHPELIEGTLAQIDEFAQRNGLAADEVARLKTEIILATAAAEEQRRRLYTPVYPQAPQGPTAPGHELPGRTTDQLGPLGAGPGSTDPYVPREWGPLTAAQGEQIGLGSGSRNGVARDYDGRPWQWDARQKKWIPEFAAGGLVEGYGNDDSELIAATPGEFVVRKAAVQRVGLGPLQALNDGRTLTSSVPAATLAPTATTFGQSGYEAEILAELRGLRQDVANLERVVYAPTIHARPDQVAPTMNEALRVARADSWVTTGQDISRG